MARNASVHSECLQHGTIIIYRALWYGHAYARYAYANI